MPSHCLVIGCNSRSRSKKTNTCGQVSFFRMPAIKTTNGAIHVVKNERRQKWIEALNRNDLTESLKNYGRICSKHFITGKPASLFQKNHPDWVPSVLMGVNTYEDTRRLLDDSPKKTKSVKRIHGTQDEKQNWNGDSQKTLISRLELNEYSSLRCKVEEPFNNVPEKVEEPLEESKSQNYIKYSEFKNALGSTLRVCQALENISHSYKTPQNVVVQPESYVVSKNQTDLLCKNISKLENTIKDVNRVLIDSVIITDDDLQSLHTEYFPGDNSAIKLANSNLKKEIEELKVKITKLESKLLIEEKFPLGQPQTIIYNQSNATTILVVTNDA